MKIKDAPPKRKLISFTVDDIHAKIAGGPKGALIIKDGRVVGMAKKFTHGFTVGKNIGFAMIDTDKAKIGDKVTIDNYDAVLAERPLLK
jgi:aminomethyltransferase